MVNLKSSILAQLELLWILLNKFRSICSAFIKRICIANMVKIGENRSMKCRINVCVVEMNTIANWADRDMYLSDKTPYTANFWIRDNRVLAASAGYWGQFHDVFDPSFRKSIQKELVRLKKETQDPWCIGFFVDNELSWGYDGNSIA